MNRSRGLPAHVSPTCYRCPFDKRYDQGCGITCAEMADRILDMEDPATVAAIMVEPIGHTGGVIDRPPSTSPACARFAISTTCC